MTYLEITGENPKEVIETGKGLFNGPMIVFNGEEGKSSESMYRVSEKKGMHDVHPDPVQAGTGLGEAQKEGKAETEAALRKLIVDLKANADWLNDSMPIPPDLKDNLIKAAKALENLRIMREWILNDIRIKDGHNAEVLKCSSES